MPLSLLPPELGLGWVTAHTWHYNTWESLKYISYCWIICLLIILPWYTTTFRSVHVRNSLSQFVIVESGAMIRKGPLIPVRRISYRNVMDWMVLPRPISSAKMQFRLKAKNIYLLLSSKKVLLKWTVYKNKAQIYQFTTTVKTETL